MLDCCAWTLCGATVTEEGRITYHEVAVRWREKRREEGWSEKSPLISNQTGWKHRGWPRKGGRGTYQFKPERVIREGERWSVFC